MRAIVFALTILLFVGCDSNKIYDNIVEFDDRAWKVAQPAEFEFVVSDTAEHYDISCTLRNSLDYPFARIFIHYALTDSAGREISKQMISNFLFDQKTGEPNGASGLGDVYDHELPLLKNYSFPYSGKYKVRLEQMMRQDTLRGVLATGLLVQVHPQEKN